MIYYNPDNDRSEECGWKKVKDEYVPTENEQNYWGIVTLIFALILATIFLLGD